LTASASTAATTQYIVGVAAAGSSQTPTVSTTSPVSFLPSTGALTAVTVTGSSDDRLKKNWAALPPDLLERIVQVKRGIYERVDVEGKHVGVSAQSMLLALAEAVLENENGFLSVNYGPAALVIAIELAERVLELEKKLE
jgi:hypothetical protein